MSHRQMPTCRVVPIIAVVVLVGLPASAQQRILSPMLMAANQEFNLAGFYYGTLPASDPESRQTDFVKILHHSGIRAIRFPGGTMANLFLFGNDKAMRETLGLALTPQTEKKAFTGLWQFLEFCRQANIEPIVQLNSVLWSEGDKVYCLVETDEKPWTGPKVIRPRRNAKRPPARSPWRGRGARRGYRVNHWEIGNEEYGFPVVNPKDYLDIATRFARAVRQADPTAHIWITLGDNGLARPHARVAQWANSLLDGLGKSDVAQDPRLGFTLHYSWRSIVDLAGAMVAKRGMTPRFAMTEFHLAGDGDYSDLSPRFGYAIELAKYLISMAADPRMEILCIHDLSSQNFGILHFNQRSYGQPDITTWDRSLGYRQMPSAQAYGLFGQLIGGTCVPGQSTSSQLAVALGVERRIFVVNENPSSRQISWDEGVIGRGTCQFQCVSLTPKPETGVNPLRVDQTIVKTHNGPITGNSLRLTLPAFSVTYCCCSP